MWEILVSMTQTFSEIGVHHDGYLGDYHESAQIRRSIIVGTSRDVAPTKG